MDFGYVDYQNYVLVLIQTSIKQLPIMDNRKQKMIFDYKDLYMHRNRRCFTISN